MYSAETIRRDINLGKEEDGVHILRGLDRHSKRLFRKDPGRNRPTGEYLLLRFVQMLIATAGFILLFEIFTLWCFGLLAMLKIGHFESYGVRVIVMLLLFLATVLELCIFWNRWDALYSEITSGGIFNQMIDLL